MRMATLITGLVLIGSTSWVENLVADDKPADLKPREARLLGEAAAQRLDRGETGEALEQGLREDLQGIRDGREDAPKGDGPGEALEHGLGDRNTENFGRFVNEQLAKGLRGRELAAAIHKELDARRARDLKPHEARKLGRAAAKRAEKGETGEDLEKGVREDLEASRGSKEEKPKDDGAGEAPEQGLNDKDAENFGRFVNDRLDEGLRGQDLASAIHKELRVRQEARRADQPGRKPETGGGGKDRGTPQGPKGGGSHGGGRPDHPPGGGGGPKGPK